jgi:hypothetical protein
MGKIDDHGGKSGISGYAREEPDVGGESERAAKQRISAKSD